MLGVGQARRVPGTLDFKGDEWTRAFWEHFGHLRVLYVDDRGREVRVLSIGTCVACWQLWSGGEREGTHEVGRARAGFRTTVTER